MSKFVGVYYRLTNGPFPAYMNRIGPSKVVHPSCSSTYRKGGSIVAFCSPSRGTSKWGAELVYSRKALTIAPFSDISDFTEIANRYALRVTTGKGLPRSAKTSKENSTYSLAGSRTRIGCFPSSVSARYPGPDPP